MNVKETLTFHLPEDKGAVYMVWGGVRCQYVHILTWWLWKVEDVLPIPDRIEIFFYSVFLHVKAVRGDLWLSIIHQQRKIAKVIPQKPFATSIPAPGQSLCGFYVAYLTTAKYDSMSGNSSSGISCSFFFCGTV